MKIIKMKNGLLALTLAAAFSFESMEAADIQTVDGRTYHNVKFDRVNKKGLAFRHNYGIVSLSPDKLSPEDRNRYSDQIADYNTLIGKQNVKSSQKSLAKKEIDAIIKMHETFNPDAISRMEKAIEKYAGTPEAEIGRKKLAEWREQKKNRLWLHHPEAVNEYRVYLFYSNPEVESLLEDIAETHWEINDLNDQYVRAKSVADMAIRQGDSDRANQALKRAKKILQKSQEDRNSNNKMFEKLLARRDSVFYNTTISGKGMCLDGVKKEYVAFIVEVTGRGKYVRAWSCEAKGGCDLFIKGREIKCVDADSAPDKGMAGDKKNNKSASSNSQRNESSEYFDLNWILKTHGYLKKSGLELKTEGFRYDAQYNLYKKEPFQTAALMNCFMADGQVTRSMINLYSYPTERAADDRLAAYSAIFESQLKGQNAESKTFASKSRTNRKEIKVYDLGNQNFLIAIYRMSILAIDKHCIFIAVFSKKYYPDAKSVVKELGK